MKKISIAILCLALPTIGMATSARFLDYRDYFLAGTPSAVAIADFNNDHIPDIVVGTAGGLQVLMGRGDGSFQAPVTIARFGIWALTVGDFNNDGKPDIAASILTNGTQLTLTLGNGDGTFQPLAVLPNGCIDCYLAAADFNGDGNMDLAVANTSQLVVLLGAGNGSFSNGPASFLTEFSVAVTTGDADKNGKADIIVSDFGSGNAVVLLGDGKAGFQRRDYHIGNTPYTAVLADLDGDGLPDMAVADRNSGMATVMLNQGGGIFGAGAKFLAGCSPFQACTFEDLAVGDFNHDGKLDLASPGAMLEGNGDGTFQAPQHFHSGAFPWKVASGDLNHDGFADLAVANSGAVNMSVLLGTPLGMSRPLGFAPGNNPKDVVAADLNGDGKEDLAVAAAADNQVNIYLGAGDGFFAKGVSLTVPGAGALIATDLDGDHKLDLAVSSLNGTWIFLGNGDGTFRQVAQYSTFYGDCTFNAFQATAAPCFASADFNGDGVPDLVGALWIQGTVSIMLGNGDGTYHLAPQTPTISDVPSGLAAADFNHDGKMDIAVSGYFGSIIVFPGKGDGTFGAGIPVVTSSVTGAGVAVGDLNGDGNADLVMAGGSGSSVISLGVFVMPGNGDFSFGAAVPLVADEAPNWVTLGDFNGDGKLDIASANLLGDSVTVLVNKGNLRFAPEVLYGAGGGPAVVRSAQINRDEKPDLVVINQFSSDLNILLHTPR